MGTWIVQEMPGAKRAKGLADGTGNRPADEAARLLVDRKTSLLLPKAAARWQAGKDARSFPFVFHLWSRYHEGLCEADTTLM